MVRICSTRDDEDFLSIFVVPNVSRWHESWTSAHQRVVQKRCSWKMTTCLERRLWMRKNKRLLSMKIWSLNMNSRLCNFFLSFSEWKHWNASQRATLRAARAAKVHVVCRASVLCNDSKAWPLHTTLCLPAVPSPHRKPVTVCYLFISVMRRERAVCCLLDCAWLLFISWMKTNTIQVLTVLALNSPCTLQLRLAGFSSFFFANLCLICISLSLLIQPHTTHTHTHSDLISIWGLTCRCIRAMLPSDSNYSLPVAHAHTHTYTQF